VPDVQEQRALIATSKAKGRGGGRMGKLAERAGKEAVL